MKIGIDIVDINRIHDLINKKGDRFLNHIFTQYEINYCKDQKHPHIHFAGRFSAKEAIKKAILSSDFNNTISLKEIEILRHDSGIPLVSLPDKMKSQYKIEVSISHTDNTAVSMAILE